MSRPEPDPKAADLGAKWSPDDGWRGGGDRRNKSDTTLTAIPVVALKAAAAFHGGEPVS